MIVSHENFFWIDIVKQIDISVKNNEMIIIFWEETIKI